MAAEHYGAQWYRHGLACYPVGSSRLPIRARNSLTVTSATRWNIGSEGGLKLADVADTGMLTTTGSAELADGIFCIL
jgi:hypothetical protein